MSRPRDPREIKVVLRPMPTWPHAPSQRRDAQFRTSYDATLRDLRNEVWQLGDAWEIVIGCGLAEFDVRKDGMPRADARPHRHPGVEISFDSQYGRLTYATDVFTDWRDNVRAIAKGLEALRAVDRWGVAKRGQQYAGFALLSAGPSLEELGRQLVETHGSVTAAMRATHPDTGGPAASARDFQAVVAYRDASAVSA